MQRILVTVAAAGLLVSASGCFFGDRVATRTIEIRQDKSTETYRGPFEIDTSQLPQGAVTSHQEEDRWGNPVTKVSVDANQPVRIVLVPATQPQQTASKRGNADVGSENQGDRFPRLTSP